MTNRFPESRRQWQEEKKEEEWPLLAPALGSSKKDFRSCLESPTNNPLYTQDFTDDQAKRIARVWNARRPGGPMEDSLLTLAREAESYNDFTARFGARIREILIESVGKEK